VVYPGSFVVHIANACICVLGDSACSEMMKSFSIQKFSNKASNVFVAPALKLPQKYLGIAAHHIIVSFCSSKLKEKYLRSSYQCSNFQDEN